MKLTKYIVLLYCNCIPFIASSQAYNYYSFNDFYDFNVSTVYDIYQDKDANIWLGTDEGLVEFNGLDFKYYCPDGYDKSASNIKCDNAGRIWFSNFTGQLFYLEKNKIHLGLDNHDSGNFIMDYSIALPHIIYINKLGNKLLKYNLLNGSETILTALNEAVIRAVDEQSQEIIFIEKHKGNLKKDSIVLDFWSYKISTGKLNNFTKLKLKNKSSRHGLLAAQETLFYWEIYDSLSIYKIEDHEFKLVSTEHLSLHGLNNIEMLDDQLTILTKTGFNTFSLQKNSLYKYTYFPSLSISHVFQDQENNLWVTTLNDGIKIITNKKITHSKLSDIEITYSCLGDNGELFYTTRNGNLFRTKPPYTVYQEIKNRHLAAGGKLQYNTYSKILYISGSEYYYNTESHQFFSHNYADNPRYAVETFRACHFFNKTEVLVCSYNIAAILNFEGNPISNKYLNYKGTHLINKGYILLKYLDAYHITKEKGKDDFYVNFKNGLIHYSHEKTRKVKYQDKDIIAKSMILAEDEGVWVGTQKGILLKIVGGNVVLSKQFPSSFSKIVEWQNRLFLADNEKVYRYDLSTESFLLLDQTDGLLNEKIVDLYVNEDTLLILGENCLQKIPCAYTETNKNIPILRIESILLFDNEIGLDDLDFEHNENSITINFSCTAIRSKNQYVYQYRLNDNKWIETKPNAPYARFSKLTSGNYKFEVRVVNEDGVKSAIQTINFSIDKHFSNKWWFILIVFSLLVLLVFLFINYRVKLAKNWTRQALEKQQLKAELYQSKIGALRAQMNPHFMFNALNSIQEFIMTNQKEIASDYLADFADLMRKYLNQSRYNEISLAEEIATLKIYLSLESLRTNAEMKYSIVCDEDLNPYGIKIPIMLLQPHIENAIKHGLLHKKGEKRLSISFKKMDNEKLVCCIEDNGVGRKASTIINNARQMKPDSFATNAIAEKIILANISSERHLKIDIIDLFEKKVSTGTRIEISLTI